MYELGSRDWYKKLQKELIKEIKALKEIRPKK